ncbi:MAG: hypothetical protein RL637_1792 [Pseudomonadota bacterium]|jgi:hypothetical protein
MSLKITTGLTALCFSLIHSVYATEGGASRYLPAFYGDFGMGLTSPEGYYLDNYLGYKNITSNGTNYNLVFELPGLVGIIDTKIAGTKYTYAFYPTVLYHDLNGTAHGGAGDMYAVPVKLSWNWDNVGFGIFTGIVTPTGAYHKGASLNTGRNYWTFDNNAVFTWYPKGGYQISFDFGYAINLENPATHYRTGDEIHLNYLVGYALTDSINIGVFGSYYRQLLQDSGSNPDAATALRGEASSIGPVVSYTTKIGERSVYFSAKWVHEYNTNLLSSDFFMLRTAFKF